MQHSQNANHIPVDPIRHDIRRLADDQFAGVLYATKPSQLRKLYELINLLFDTDINLYRRLGAFRFDVIENPVAVFHRQR
ncbi:hypothetical protein G6F50_018331 [Rhizopus delemar]|uniref:Uncharacterized protein n=1 Tax=Rhizopus delemar TaxID=936053 RepID=A0A9P6XN40_9FUNG|nr:hypothetical protein G6F50_018331 [Rhizopus delemar]